MNRPELTYENQHGGEIKALHIRAELEQKYYEATEVWADWAEAEIKRLNQLLVIATTPNNGAPHV
jgi:hypothetical protein